MLVFRPIFGSDHLIRFLHELHDLVVRHIVVQIDVDPIFQARIRRPSDCFIGLSQFANPFQGRSDIRKTSELIESLRLDFELAERQGFEPWVPARAQRFSRPPRSTTPASFLGFCGAKVGKIFGLRKSLGVFLFKKSRL